jgi:hypothetical protein
MTWIVCNGCTRIGWELETGANMVRTTNGTTAMKDTHRISLLGSEIARVHAEKSSTGFCLDFSELIDATTRRVSAMLRRRIRDRRAFLG